MKEPEPFSVWRHVATDTFYVVFRVATDATNGPHEGHRAVVYWCLGDRYLTHNEITDFFWSYGDIRVSCRDLSEFLDGRFEEYKERS